MDYEEYHLQVACVEWLDYQYPDLLHTISPITKLSMMQGLRQKKMGYQKGTLDLTIYRANHKYHGLVIEFKKKKGKLTEDQAKTRARLLNEGYFAVKIDNFDDFVLLIRSYFQEKKGG